MLVREFNFELPQELIARYPSPERDSSRLMLLDRLSGTIQENIFRNLPDYMKPGDLLVMNDTRVIPARLFGNKLSGGKVEIFLLRRDGEPELWECMLRASKRFREGQQVQLASGMTATLQSRIGLENWLIQFEGSELFSDWLDREGHIPLPPYLQREDIAEDRERYQTVVAKNAGAVAAPTAGLHFTSELIAELSLRGVNTVFLTLHTGIGTFRPVRAERVEDHQIHSEHYKISAETVDAISRTKAAGGRVIAVGTTTARTLEYCADTVGNLTAGEGSADIYIYPGYRFKVVDALITNFHLPESTLLMLVSAFAGREFVLDAYQKAVSSRFRFYSYGDAMLIQ